PKTFKYLKSLFLVFFIFSAFLTSSGARPETKNDNKPAYSFTNIVTDNGAFYANETIIQDSIGYIWIGTQKGLYKFDGISTKHFISKNNKASLLHDWIYSLYEDKNGHIWIGYRNSGLSKLDPKNETFEHFSVDSTDNKKIAGSTIKAIAEDKDGNIWIGTNKGLNKYNAINHTIEFFDKTAIPTKNILSLTLDEVGKLWVGTEQGLYVSDSAINKESLQFSKIELIDSNDAKISSILIDKNFLWVGTIANGIYKIHLPSLTINEMFSERLDWSVGSVNHIIKDNRDNLWFATKYGLGFLPSNRSYFYLYSYQTTQKNSIASNSINKLLVDQQDNIWVLSLDSIQKINIQSALFASFSVDKTKAYMLKEQAISMIAHDNDQNLWLGGDTTGLYQLNPTNKDFLHYQLKSKSIFKMTPPNVKGFLSDSSDRYWIGTNNFGVMKIEKNKIKKTWFKHDINNRNSISSDENIQFFYEDSKKRIWIGTNNGINRYREETNDFKTYLSDITGKQGYFVLAINETKQGHIIVGTTVGKLFVLATGENFFREILTKDMQGFNNNFHDISSIKVRNGIIWITDYGKGLLKGNLTQNQRGNFIISGEFFGVDHGLKESSVNSLHFDFNDKNAIWLNTDLGISKFDIAAKKFYNFNEQDGVKPGVNWINCNSQSQQGIIYYCGPAGVLYFDPKNIKINRIPPEVVLTNFYVNSKRIELNSEDKISPLQKIIQETESLLLNDKQTNFAFDFTALDFTAPSKNKYAYKLEGFDQKWTYTDAKRRHANYSNIPAGNYTFKVKASNNHGFWNEIGTQVKITVLPPWWLTWWMQIIYIALFVMTVLWIIRNRTKQHKQRSLILEKAVLERTYELEQKTYDLEERTRSLKAAQKTIVAQEKMSSLGTLTAGVAHEINNPTNFTHAAVYMMKEEIANIKSFLKQLAGGDNADPEILKSFEDKFAKLIELTETATEGTTRIKTIVNDLRTYSRLDEAAKKSVRLAGILASTVHLIKTQYHTIEIDVDIESDPILACFPAKLSQVFMNVTVNACQAILTKQKNDPELSGKITITVTLHQELIEITFKDNGCGMNSITQKKIFDPFFTTKDVGSGTGLGMAISFGIIEDHRGTLKVSSMINKGSTITICLPIK
ncbi:MAG: hypothetical protein HRT52_03260, partial [Colwellia sp.]|nr:hypothetical protein [Colwellia sp.]